MAGKRRGYMADRRESICSDWCRATAVYPAAGTDRSSEGCRRIGYLLGLEGCLDADSQQDSYGEGMLVSGSEGWMRP